MSGSLEDNPFVQLFPSIEAAKNYAQQFSEQPKIDESKNEKKSSPDVNNEITIPKQFMAINDCIEKIFGITFNKQSQNSAVLLSDVATDPNQIWISMDILEQALFERLLLPQPAEHVVTVKNSPLESHFVEEKVITYLFGCYERINAVFEKRPLPELKQMENLVLRNISTALKQPELYSEQTLNTQFFEIFSERATPNYMDPLVTFLNLLVAEMIKDEPKPNIIINQAFIPILNLTHIYVARSTLTSFPVYIVFGLLLTLAKNKYTADTIITYSTPAATASGSDYANTLIGAILCLSCLPKTNNGEYLYFGKDQLANNSEGPIWSAMEAINDSLYNVFFQLMKISPEVKGKTLSWIRNCLKVNKERGKLWATHGVNPFADLNSKSASDAFMLNLCSVLLRLCEPIICDETGQKYRKIDPTFGAWNGFGDETCLVPTDASESRPKSDSYNFITEIFFLTHKAVDLGYRVCVETLIRLSQDVQRLVELNRLDRFDDPNVAEVIQDRMKSEVQRLYTLKAALLEPRTQQLLSQLNVTTSRWLVQVVLDVGSGPRSSYTIDKEIPLKFPLPEEIPATLTCVPEFFLENINCFLPFTKKFSPEKLEEGGMDALEPIVTMIIVMMGSGRIVRNPHLRACLAESLEALVPKADELNAFWRPEVFKKHSHCQQIIPSLLDVFISIEMTGENVQFHQKFDYRRSIYIVLEYLWKIDAHKECFRRLADDAEKNITAATPPLFLRFLHLLINDAVYLLDEALQSMAQLKTMQAARDSGDWAKLPPREREEQESFFTQTGTVARFYNILGKWTIDTLQYITSEIKSIFSHPTMVDRMAAMLNFFLHHLVGPKMKSFKVKEKEEYEFRPGDIVLAICQIYINLGESDQFCLAISQDGRSYNERLFDQAEKVLCRIGGSLLVAELRTVAARVAVQASKQKEKDEFLTDVPEEFLDPITSTLLVDPVILPTTHVTVDRSTIARHLLSDQTDPFNRSPLTLDQVIPNVDLKNRIEAWIKERAPQESTTCDVDHSE